MIARRTIPLLFVIVIISLTITLTPTITSVLALSPSLSAATSSPNPSPQKESDNSKSTFKITDKLKSLINGAVDNNKTNAAIVVGIVDPNGTGFYGHGKMSNANKGHKITLENLATHTSGLPEFAPNYCPSFFKENPRTPSDEIQLQIRLAGCTKNYTFDQFYQGLSNTTVTREPGTKVEYSTFGSALLGNILTLKSNISSYEELLTKRVLNVLGMDSTSINLSNAQKSRLAIGHLYGQELPSLNFSNPIAPGGGLYSSASDMLKFISANIGIN
jgi:hypothetical protein